MEVSIDRALPQNATLVETLAQSLDTPIPFTTSIDGLSEAEVAARKARGQVNQFHLGTSRTYLQILRQHAFSFINLVLIALGITLVVMGRWDDAFLTAGMVVLNVVVAVGQEGRAKQKLDKIALLTRPKAIVVREGRESVIDPGEIVLGDVLQVGPGDQIVVDGQVIGDGRIEVDESLLTGESDRVPKKPGDPVYSGSYCMSGRARYMACNVGAGSFANQIISGARAYRRVKTPLQKDIDFVVRLLLILSIQLGILIGLSFVYSQLPIVERVQIAAVIAALVPQGLFAMVTVTYAMGALRMAGKGALIQQINAIESLSNVDVLCLDKTGTLTTNSLKLETTLPLETSESELKRILGDFAASIPGGNRTASAVAEAFPGQARTVKEEVEFSSVRKWSALSFDDEQLRGVYVMGAPEMVQPALREGTDLAGMQAQVNQWADQGLRVLIFAYQPEVVPLHDATGDPELPAGLIPLGLISLRDELRKEARNTLHGFSGAGVHIKIISGDSPQTVAALAKQSGLEGDVKVISGLDLEAMDEKEFAQAAAEGTIFGRISPQQKEQLVSALRDQGHYVAMIGDGVNDVLSLKQAQLAIAMESGSQATRGVADIVLLDDSFAILPSAVIEGQKIIRGMQDVMRLMLSHTFLVALIILGCAIIDVAFPTTPKLRTLWTLLAVGVPTLAVAGWARPGASSGSLMRPVFRFVLPAGFTMAVLGLLVYLTYMYMSGDVLLARTALTVTALLAGLLLIPFVEPPTPFWVAGDDLSGDWRPTALAAAMFVTFVVVMLITPAREFFALRPLPPLDVAVICAVVVVWALGLRLAWRKKFFERLLLPEPGVG